METKKTRKQKFSKNLPLLNLNAAGIDVGSEEHYVAVPEDRDDNSVKMFESFTSDLHKLAKWLKKCKIDTVVMESTGVYWIPLFEILEDYGFEVLLVNANYAKNVPGRKSDVSDSQWLQQLHTYGLLRGSFQPDSKIKELRTYLRQRDSLVKCAASHVQHMQKSLTLMNVKLQHVISDITGKSGMEIIRAIIKGEREPDKLVQYCDKRLKSSKETIKKSLEGSYKEDNIFSLKQSVELYDFYQTKIEECDDQILELLKSFDEKEIKSSQEDKHKKKRRSMTSAMSNQLVKVTGVDLTQIDGLNSLSVLTLISETGLDMSKWKTEKHFTSWLGLSPNNQITGGKIISSKTKKNKSRSSKLFRLGAQSLLKSQSYLGGFYRRMRYRIGTEKAIVATARKIAVIYYNMLKNGQAYYDFGHEYYEQQYKERNLKYLKRKAEELGLDLIKKPA